MGARSFGVLILTHKRPDKLHTLKMLKRHGYEGPIRLVVDDLDPTLPQYLESFGDDVVVFSKKDTAHLTDVGDNAGTWDCVVYARNACWDIAAALGWEYFLVLDDDYRSFWFRQKGESEMCSVPINKHLGEVFDAFVDYLAETPQIATVASSQVGDWIGGLCHSGMRRKAMNVFFCATSRRFSFFGRINEDVNAYVCNGRRGELYLTVMRVAVEQKNTQTQSGGLTDIYLRVGTYQKSFYTVMYAPSCSRISTLGNDSAENTNDRIHHAISWRHAVPKIIRETHRKPRSSEAMK